MQESLGISISDKIVRYALVEKNNGRLNIKSYGLQFYSDETKLKSLITQVLNETTDSKTLVGINIPNERYYHFDLPNVQNQEYLTQAINTEFDSFCANNKLNRTSYEGRYIITKEIQNKDKKKIIYIYDDMKTLNERKSLFNSVRLESATPLSITYPNLLERERGQNSLIVDLEGSTTVTEILNGEIYHVDVLNIGLKDTFEEISRKENSYSKAYERLKGTTLYSSASSMQANGYVGENEYIGIITPAVLKITQEIKNIISACPVNINKIYLTGLGTAINNIDVFFQDYFKDQIVSILKPYFAEGMQNLQDIIEVNGAVSLALQAQKIGEKGINFAEGEKFTFKRLVSLLNTPVSDIKANSQKNKEGKPKKKNKIKEFFKEPNDGTLSGIDLATTRDMVCGILGIVIYIIISLILMGQINTKKAEVKSINDSTREQMARVKADTDLISSRKKDYDTFIKNLQDSNSEAEVKRSKKNQITNFLQRIVYTIPKEVKITDITTSDNSDGTRHVVIKCESSKYEQIAYFKAKIKNDGILDNVQSGYGDKQNNKTTIVATIEGDLPTY